MQRPLAMLKAAIVLFVLSIVAGVLAFTGLTPTSGSAATVSFFALLAAAITTFAVYMIRR